MRVSIHAGVHRIVEILEVIYLMVSTMCRPLHKFKLFIAFMYKMDWFQSMKLGSGKFS